MSSNNSNNAANNSNASSGNASNNGFTLTNLTSSSSSSSASSTTSAPATQNTSLILTSSSSTPPPPPLPLSLPQQQQTSQTILNTTNTNNTTTSTASGMIPAAAVAAAAATASATTPTILSASTAAAAAAAAAAANNDNKMDTSGPLNNGCTFNNGMASNSFGSFGSCSNSSATAVFVGDVISRLYPNVNQQETPLPRQWSTIHKCQTLSLTNSNLRVTYKGPGKTHKDAASVRTDYPIPAACGIYYFEVKIVSKGRDGYMGIGLSKSDVLLSRLPGWDKNSYGYHGDDGHSFCCSGTGQNYGPTFTTGDVIGCCLNLIENTCFYTKNGYNLGIAFRDLPSDLYPTVGLQTPSESVEANFGQYPFEFDIHNYVKEWHLKTRQTIERYPMKKENENNLPIILRKLISTYLVHHGYSATAEAFAKSVGHVFEEELASIRNRQKIQKLVLMGQLEESINLTYQLFPGILDRNHNLLFALKVRQFIEMIYVANPKSQSSNNTTASSSMPPAYNNHLAGEDEDLENESFTSSKKVSNCHNYSKMPQSDADSASLKEETTSLSSVEISMDQDNNNSIKHLNGNLDTSGSNGYVTSKNGTTTTNTNYSNSDTTITHNSCNNSEEKMDMDSPSHSTNKTAQTNHIKDKNLLLDSNNTYLQSILEFGRELFQMNSRFTQEQGSDNPINTKMLRDAFSLLAYHDPWSSPLGFQLEPSQREPISALLNSAILESNNMPRIPPLEVVYGQTSECMRLMSKYGVAWCAYVNLADYMQS